MNPGQNFSTLETEIGENPNDELEDVEPTRSVDSNICGWPALARGNPVSVFNFRETVM